VMVE